MNLEVCSVMVIVLENGLADPGFKSWTMLVAFHIDLLPLVKVFNRTVRPPTDGVFMVYWLNRWTAES